MDFIDILPSLYVKQGPRAQRVRVSVCVTCGLFGVVAHEAEPTSLLLAVAKQVEETHLLQLSLEAVQVLKTEAKTNIWQPLLRFLNFQCIVRLKHSNQIKGETPKCIRPNNDNTFSLTARKATSFFFSFFYCVSIHHLDPQPEGNTSSPSVYFLLTVFTAAFYLYCIPPRFTRSSKLSLHSHIPSERTRLSGVFLTGGR